MATRYRKTADTVSNPQLPKLPQGTPKDWPAGLYEILRAILLVLETRNDVVFGIQANGTKQPLRAWLNFTAGVTITDDPTSDRTNLSVP